MKIKKSNANNDNLMHYISIAHLPIVDNANLMDYITNEK